MTKIRQRQFPQKKKNKTKTIKIKIKERKGKRNCRMRRPLQTPKDPLNTTTNLYHTYHRP